MSFLGRDVTLNIFSPHTESPIITPQTRTVTRESVEFADTSQYDSTDPNDGFEVVNADVDVSSRLIVYTIDDNGGTFSSSGDFNGFVVTDTSGAIRPITDVSIVSGSDFAIPTDNLIFSENSIAVDFSGQSFERGDQLILLVTFRERGPGGPIVGTEDDDILTGSARDDRINGRGSSDILDGQAGNDLILGGGGSDVITGGGGEDLMRGGDGSDRYDYNSVDESHGKLADLITDFAHGIDKIDLQTIDADTATTTNQAFVFVGSAGFSEDSAGELRYYYIDNRGGAQDRTILAADVNGDGRSDFDISLKGLLTLSSDDFIL